MPTWFFLALSLLLTTPACHQASRPAASPSRWLPTFLHGKHSHGRVAQDQPLELRIHISPDERAMDDYLEAMADPDSPDFGHTLTPTEFRERFGPTHDQLARARLFLQNSAIRVKAVRGGFIHATADAGTLERAFGTELHHLGDDDHGSQGYGPLTAPQVAPELGIVAVHGLSSAPRRRPHKAQSAHHAAYFNASQLRQAYAMPAAATGAGVRVGLLELDGYDYGDVLAYTRANAIPDPHLTNILLDGATGHVVSQDAQMEVELDIAMVLAMAPRAADVRLYIAPQVDRAWMDLLGEMVDPTQGDRALCPLISISWGAPELQSSPSQLHSESLLFRQMAIQGQTVFAASGDDGARDDGTDLGVDDPASQPYVMGVGGTRLTTTPSGAYQSESAWTHGGGGNSAIWAAPSWQRPLTLTAPLAQSGRRLVPDVAANGDPDTGHLVYVGGNWTIVGGTSAAAPLWAGMMADVLAMRAAKGLKPLGWLGLPIYSRSKSGMHDVTQGQNGYYPAAPGFDLATGWGSFDGALMETVFTAP